MDTVEMIFSMKEEIEKLKDELIREQYNTAVAQNELNAIKHRIGGLPTLQQLEKLFQRGYTDDDEAGLIEAVQTIRSITNEGLKPCHEFVKEYVLADSPGEENALITEYVQYDPPVKPE